MVINRDFSYLKSTDKSRYVALVAYLGLLASGGNYLNIWVLP